MTDKTKKIVPLSVMLLTLAGVFAIVCFGMAPAAGPIAVPPAARVPGVFLVTDYGAVGDGHTDDSAAIQRAFDAAKGSQRSHYSHPIVQFPPLFYRLSKTIQCPICLDVQGIGQAELVGNGQPAFNWATAWRVNVSHLSFTNFSLCLSTPTSNINSAMIDVGFCSFDHSCKVAFDTGGFAASRSSIVHVHDCYSGADQFTRIGADASTIEDCWIDGFGQTYEVMTLDSAATVRRCIFVEESPVPAGSKGAAWIGYYASDTTRPLVLQDCRMLAENGGNLPVMCHADGERSWLADQKCQNGITFRECELAPGPVWGNYVVFAGNVLPNFVHFLGCGGITPLKRLVGIADGWTCPQFDPRFVPCDICVDSTSRRVLMYLDQSKVVADPLMQFVSK